MSNSMITNLVDLDTDTIDNIFEMDDFTNLTDFERTSFSLEVILRKWNIHVTKNTNLNKKNIEEIEWIENSEKFSFKNINLLIKYYHPKIGKINESTEKCDVPSYQNIIMNKFYTNVPEFVNKYGIIQWILICPESESNVISSKDDLTLLMSCLECCDIYCNIPFLIQFENTFKHLFYGFQKNKYSKYEYKSCYFKTISKFNIVDIFYDHFKYDTIKESDILHSSEFEYTYNLTKDKRSKYTFSYLFENFQFMDQLFEILKYDNDSKGIKNYIKGFKLLIQSDRQCNGEVNKCSNSKIDILSIDNNLSKWLFHTKFKNDGSNFLTNILKEYLTLFKDFEIFNTSIQNILLNVNERVSKKNFANSLFFSENVKIDSNNSLDLSLKTVTVEEIKGFQLNSKAIIKKLFSCAKHPPIKQNNSECCDNEYLLIKINLDKSKSAPSYSIIEFISLTISIILYKEKHGIIFSCILWNEFLNYLQNYFEISKHIPGIPKKSQPIFSHSTLQQDIEFLQCCINSKKKWSSFNDYQKYNGRSCKSKLTLYHYPNENIYIPILQDKIPQTEEMFHNEMENMIKTSSEERNVNQLIFLISDMSAFKAANPKCCFEDFIRWHSPNDWIFNNENNKYEFSPRMSSKDNTWRKAWDECIPLSVYKQKKHFNENEEWKKTIDKIKNITFGELISLILPSVFKGMIQLLFDNFEKFSSTVNKKFKKLSIDFLQSTYESNIEMYENILNDFSFIENYIERSFLLKSFLFNSGSDASYIEHILMDMADNNTIKIENNKRNEIKNLIETTIIDKDDNFVFEDQIESSKHDIFYYYNARIYMSYSKDGSRIYSKLPVLNNINKIN
uniref:Rab3 GTPase-activating protein catalytic subunit n=1 Tax=Strongyloides papillosus TaxID=174720 RepID=A0A0N5CD77_STREA